MSLVPETDYGTPASHATEQVALTIHGQTVSVPAGTSIMRAAMDAGFSRAFATVFDSNMTTTVAAVVLFFLGTGPIKGFAITLIIGNILSMFTAITVTRFMLRSLIASNLLKNSKFFGA